MERARVEIFEMARMKGALLVCDEEEGVSEEEVDESDALIATSLAPILLLTTARVGGKRMNTAAVEDGNTTCDGNKLRHRFV